jgi:hypothetical protein
MATKIIQQNRFDGGLTENVRDTSGNKVWYTENVLLENGMVAQTANCNTVNSYSYNPEYNIIRLITVGGTIYGLGQDNVTNKDVSIYTKTLAGNWALVTNGTISGSNLRLYDPFFLYYDGAIYFDGGNNYVCRYVVSTNAMTNNFQSLNGGLFGGVMWQGNMYGYQGQKIYKITTAPAATDMITIPVEQTIQQMIPYGNYMAIICSSNTQPSKMYIWDGVTTTTFTDIVEIGEGQATGGAVLDGTIYAVIGYANGKGIRIKAYSGGAFISVYNYSGRFNRAGTYNYTLAASKVKSSSGYITFLVNGTRSDSAYAPIYETQVFRYGKTNPQDNNTLTCWKTLNTQEGQTGFIPASFGNDFIVMENALGQYNQNVMFIGTVYNLGGTSTSYYYEMTNAYNATESISSASAVLETVIFNCGNAHAEKALKKVVLTYDPLPTAGSVTLKYKINEDTNKAASTWTTIFTDTVDYNVSHSAVNIESTGANLPTFKEIQFRIELSGNAKLTGIKFVYDELTEKEY